VISAQCSECQSEEVRPSAGKRREWACGPDHASILEMVQRRLVSLSNASLKPQQKVAAVRDHLVPSLYHLLTFSKVGVVKLRCLDRMMRRWVKRWLHLPKDVCNAAFHASVGDGGLGIASLEFRIRRLRRKRTEALSNSSDPVVLALLGTPRAVARLTRLNLEIRLGRTIIENSQTENAAWREELVRSVDGGGLTMHADCPKLSQWVTDDSYNLKGGEFIRAIHVRLNSMITPSRATRGRRIADANKCRLDRQIANSTHIVQVCAASHGLRVKRHDKVVRRIGAALSKKGFKILYEPRLPYQRTFRKPDLLVWKGQRAYILDPIICGDRVCLEERQMGKQLLYGDQEVTARALERIEESGSRLETISAHGIAMNFRGAMTNLTVRFLKELGVTARELNYMIVGQLNDSWGMLRTYRDNTAVA